MTHYRNSTGMQTGAKVTGGSTYNNFGGGDLRINSVGLNKTGSSSAEIVVDWENARNNNPLLTVWKVVADGEVVKRRERTTSSDTTRISISGLPYGANSVELRVSDTTQTVTVAGLKPTITDLFGSGGGQTGSAIIVVRNARALQNPVNVNDQHVIQANITNIGQAEGGGQVTLTVNGTPVASEVVNLAGGEDVNVRFNYTPSEYGISSGNALATVKINSSSAKAGFEITSPTGPGSGDRGDTGGGTGGGGTGGGGTGGDGGTDGGGTGGGTGGGGTDQPVSGPSGALSSITQFANNNPAIAGAAVLGAAFVLTRDDDSNFAPRRRPRARGNNNNNQGGQ